MRLLCVVFKNLTPNGFRFFLFLRPRKKYSQNLNSNTRKTEKEIKIIRNCCHLNSFASNGSEAESVCKVKVFMSLSALFFPSKINAEAPSKCFGVHVAGSLGKMMSNDGWDADAGWF